MEDTIQKHFMKCSMQNKQTPGGRQSDAPSFIRNLVSHHRFLKCLCLNVPCSNTEGQNYFFWFSCAKF